MAAALRQALHQYQGAYWAWKESATEENAIALEESTGKMRRLALAVINNLN
jgi:hypothetical protein